MTSPLSRLSAVQPLSVDGEGAGGEVPPRRAAIQDALLSWYARERRDLPWRRTRDPYAILVSEVMLQQTQVDRVIPKYQDFLGRFPTFAALATAPVADVIRAWAPLGYNQRAVRLWRAARRVTSGHGGALPPDPETLRALDGVGEYTASAVGCFAFGWQVPVVDTNVRRVLCRVLWGGVAPTRKDLREAAGALLPKGQASDWSQALMDLGATVCLSRRPRCGVCPLRAQCAAAPTLQGGASVIAEVKTGYRAAPFQGSSRYYRGRILHHLRGLNPGGASPLSELGLAVRKDFTQEHIPWLEEMVERLARDGLARVNPGDGDRESSVSLP